MSNQKDDRCTRYDGEDGTAETLGDALGPGVTTDDLAEIERVLQRFETVAIDEFDDHPDWLRTAHRAVARALEHYDSELGQNSTDGAVAGHSYSEKSREAAVSAVVENSDTDRAYCGAYAARQNADGSVEVYELTEVLQSND